METTQHRQTRTQFNGLFFHDNLGKPAPEILTNLDFNKPRDDGDFCWRLKDDTSSIGRMCTCTEFQVEVAETKKVRWEKLRVMPVDLTRRFVLEECKDLGGR